MLTSESIDLSLDTGSPLLEITDPMEYNLVVTACKKILRFIHLIVLKTHRLSLRFPRTVVGITLVVSVVGLLGASKLQMLLSIDDLIDPDFSTYEELKSLNENFADNGSLYGLFTPKNGGELTKDNLCLIRGWLQHLGDTSTEISMISTSFGPSVTMNTPNTLGFKPILDPNCGTSNPESENISSSLRTLRESPWGVALTSKNHNDVVVNILVRPPEQQTQYGSINTKAVDEIILSFDQENKNSDLKAWWTGVAFFQTSLKKGYELTSVLSLGMFVLVVLLFRLIFGTWKSGLLFFLSYLIAMIWTYGGMGFAGAPIDVLSNALGLLVLVASLEDFLFVCFIAQRYPGKSWRTSFRHLLVPSFFTSVTTAVGFDSLSAGGLDIISRFGSWSAFAAMTEWFIVFMFLPALLKLFPKLRSFTNSEPAKWTLSIESLQFWSIPRFAALASIPLYAVGLIGAQSLVVQDAPHRIFSESHPFRQTMSYIKDTRGWITELSLVFEDPDEEKFNRSAIEKIKTMPKVRGIESPYAVADYLQQGLPQHRGTLAKNLYELSPFSRRLVGPNESQVRAIIFLEDTDIVHVNALRDEMQQFCNEKCHIAGTLVSYGEFGDRVLKSFLSSMGLSIALVLLILFFLNTALTQKSALAMLVSSIWGPMMLLSAFVIFKWPISYTTSLFVSLLVGMAGDNAIHYIFANSRHHSAHAYKGLGGASILMTLCMIIVSSTLFVSIFAPMKTLGLLLIVGFILTLLGDFWIFQALEGLTASVKKKWLTSTKKNML